MPEQDATHRRNPKAEITEIVDLVKDYAKQETIGPLRGAGRWMAFGAIGAFLYGLGIVMLVLGVLRLVQSQWPEVFDGGWSWVPYVAALLVCLLAMYIALRHIRKNTLAKEPR